MNASELGDFCSAVGEMIDAMASFKRSVTLQCEVAAMQAENAHRASNGLSPAYGEEAFYAIAVKHGAEI